MITLPRGYNAERPQQSLVFADGGLPEVMRWLESTRDKTGGRGNGGGPYDTSRNDFNGYSTWEDVVRWTRDGWREGAERIQSGFPKPQFSPEFRPHWGYDVAGATPDIGRFVAGDPMHMATYHNPNYGRKKYIVLYIGMGIRAEVSTKEFTNFGIAVCQLIDTLENSGIQVELNQATRASIGASCVTGWRVKGASEPLNMASVAFTYMHVAAHRRLQFQMRTRIGSGGIGGSMNIVAADVPDAPKDAVVFAGISDNVGACETLQGAREFLRTRINEGAGTELVTTEMLEHLN